VTSPEAEVEIEDDGGINVVVAEVVDHIFLLDTNKKK